ncbi:MULTISPECIES: SDR family NAD(P)-dependent oxidoreductase [Actinotignum]|uniref:SDR family oxidoreductase n=1 Tax=Actinotignum timonense TaxID=1870995 RepID=A0AAW9HCR6_9ACTO|nr:MULTISPECIES: SDR family oxidoreductase [Actinotignum]AIE82391.1 2-hydroxypropyl-CoM dehydrogenase [Actinotignum schaalii]MDE1557798.1 SDR family NAD(P)-dependent oxidoreductase [Actinotignum schaalii]MDE1663702.1 SDR family NAD(P)-dependent oxidoreductase [Actinotignum schaalii]MDK6373920.1 SDR family oxidoreductase [Actinotignum timonense]MDK6590977.1 SDR family oxidoreductase [Actinotignum timonense]
MSQKTAVITGAASGMGLTEAKLFAERGYKVALLDVNEDGLKSAVAEIKAAGGEASSFTIDLTDHDSIIATVAEVEKEFEHIDVLVNNAGVFDKYQASLDTPRERWDFLLAINLTSVFDMTNAVLPGMLKRGEGAVVNIASVAGIVAAKGGAAYTAAKHAVIGYTKHLASEYSKEGIRFNAVAPGTIVTPLVAGIVDSIPTDPVPLRRFGQPEEVAEAVFFLADGKAGFVNGTTLTVDGGFTIQ